MELQNISQSITIICRLEPKLVQWHLCESKQVVSHKTEYVGARLDQHQWKFETYSSKLPPCMLLSCNIGATVSVCRQSNEHNIRLCTSAWGLADVGGNSNCIVVQSLCQCWSDIIYLYRLLNCHNIRAWTMAWIWVNVDWITIALWMLWLVLIASEIWDVTLCNANNTNWHTEVDDKPWHQIAFWF